LASAEAADFHALISLDFVLDPAWEFLKYFGHGAKDEVPPKQ
jgi:hypothetical protein